MTDTTEDTQEQTLVERIDKMDKAELITYANMTFGANVNARMSKAEIAATVLRASAKFRGNTSVGMAGSALKPGHARIRINKTELNKSGRPVIVGLQGTMYSLPVGVEFTCPLPLVEILDHAVQVQYETDPATNDLVPRQIHSYPFVVLETAK